MLRPLMALAIILVGQAAWAQDKTSATYAALKKEYEAAQKDFADTLKKAQTDLRKELADAKTDEQREAIINKFSAMQQDSPGGKFAVRFAAFADGNPRDPAALEAVAMALRVGGPGLVKSGLRSKIIDSLRANFITSPNIGMVVRQVVSIPDENAERFVKDLIAKNPDQKVQAKACKSLAENLRGYATGAERIKDNAKLRANVEKQFGKEFIDKLIANADKMEKHADDFDKLVKEKYADVFPNLSVGKLAPEVISKNLEDKEVKLSALRGKVVVLDIWATWCGPCRAMIPHEREMVNRLKDQPFALVSISADEKKETLTEFLMREPMPWTHWWNGQEGGIMEDWEVTSFPTIYVLDAKGVIRFKNIRGKELEESVNELLKELDGKSK